MAIAKTTVTHTIFSPSEDPVQRSGTIQLGGFVGREWRDIQGMTNDGQIITWEPADADENGEWSVQLVPNEDVASPANTLYRYLPAQGQPVVFQVPRSVPSVTLLDCLVYDPANWPSLAPTSRGGESAYEVAVRDGFEGTEREWLDSLVGLLIEPDANLDGFYVLKTGTVLIPDDDGLYPIGV